MPFIEKASVTATGGERLGGAVVSEITDGSDRIIARVEVQGDVVFDVYRGGAKVAYLGLDLFTSTTKADFAEAILATVAPKRLAPKVEPAPVLPTEPGLYRDTRGGTWHLGREGWTLVVGYLNLPTGLSEPQGDRVPTFLPLVRLTTAEEVEA